MMARKTVVAVLVLTVAVCPFTGLAAAVAHSQPDSGAVANGATPAACCAGCRTSGPPRTDNQGTPTDNKPEPVHCNCICGGVVFASADDATASLDNMTVAWTTDLDDDICHRGGNVDIGATDRSRACHFPPFASGRDVRTLCASFLI